MKNYEKSYTQLTPEAKLAMRNFKRKERREMNNLEDVTTLEAVSLPMSAVGQTPATQNADPSGGQVRVSYDKHLPCLPQAQDGYSGEKAGIANGMQPILQTNALSQPVPVGTPLRTQNHGGQGGPAQGNIKKMRPVTLGVSGDPSAGGVYGYSGGTASGGFDFSGGSPAASIPNNPSANKVEGSAFVVNGVRYESMPADDAAAKAIALRESAEAAGQAPYVSGKNGKWDGSVVGREWVTKNIYLPVIKKNPDKYKNPEASAKYFGGKLATNKESYWSSWFFRRCYEAYWDLKSENRAPGLDSSTIFDYTADQGLALRQKVEANPDQYKGQTLFLTFRNTEAPIFIGDAIWNSRTDTNSFEVLKPTGRQSPSHMKVITTVDGDNYRAIGGNEGKASTVNNVLVKVDANKMLAANSYYKAVYKRVVCLGAEKTLT